MAMDKAWWEVTQPEFNGDKVSLSAHDYARHVMLRGSPKNSGAAALMFAAAKDADKIILLGYDCKYGKEGKRHWHGDHAEGMVGNAGSMPKWPKQFASLMPHLRHIDVVNCTRDTDLMCWPIRELEEELCSFTS